MDVDGLRTLFMSDDPYPGLHELREVSTMQRIGDRQWVALGYDAVRRVVRDPAFTTGALGGFLVAGLQPGAAAHDYVANRINFLDPPRHTRVRRTVDRWFSPRRVRSLRQDVEQIAAELADRFEGRAELVSALAHPLPARVICRLLGADEPDELAAWGEDVAMLLTLGRTTAQTGAGERAAEAFSAWVAEVDRTDLDLPEAERRSLIMTLFAAGHHTTRDLFANGMTALLRRPDQLALAMADPAATVEELLRFDTPTQMVSRVAPETTEIDGHEVEAGSVIIAALGAANRDPACYPDPDRLDVTRTGPPPLSFAPGPHHCLGAPLARMEVEVMLTTVLGRWPDVRLADPDQVVPRRPSAVFHGLTRLEVDLA
jgi:cytochrome P450